MTGARSPTAAWGGRSGPRAARTLSHLAVPALLLLTGAAGLGYQVVWIRLLAVELGGEVTAMLSVLGAVLAGLAIGAFALDGSVARSARPAVWYAGLEAAIGLWSLALWFAMPRLAGMLGDLVGPDPSALRHVALAGGATFLLLAPATIPMGATLPAAERMQRTRIGMSGDVASGGVGLLYAANVLGAAFGAAATLTLLGPLFGLLDTLPILAALNLLCAAVATTLSRPGRAALPARLATRDPRSRMPAVLFATGLLGIGFEIVVARGVAQTLENTVYSYATVLTLYLAGAAVGAAVQARRPLSVRGLLGLLAGATLVGSALLPAAPALNAAFVGAGLPRGAAEVTVVAAIFLPGAAAMGAAFAALAERATGPDGGLGRALGSNLLGGASASVVVGLVLIPTLGTVRTGAALAAGYALLALVSLRGRAAFAAAAAAIAAGAAFLLLVPPHLVALRAGERIVAHRETSQTTATVLRDASGADRLVVDGRFAMGGDRTEGVDRLQGHVPLLLHPAPRAALFLGLGSGATAAAAADHPGLAATAVELAAPVVAVLPAFVGPAADIARAGIVVRTDDARRVARTDPRRYDVIVADTFHPARDGAALLYTREHFAAVRDRLAPGGLFAQWIPLHQFDLPMLRIVVRTFLDVFPDARLVVANANLDTPLLALVGTDGAAPPTPAALAARVADPALVSRLASLGLDGPFALLGGHVAGPVALAVFAGDAPRNTDAFPRLLFEAPRSVYEPLGPASDRLLSLLDLPRAPGDVVTLGPARGDAAFARRLEAYWTARDRFVRLGASSKLTGRPQDDATAIAPALLRIVGGSPDYAPARRPLLALAEALAPVDPDMAAQILDRAIAVADGPDLRAARARLGGTP